MRLRLGDHAQTGRAENEPGRPLFAGALAALAEDVILTRRDGKRDVEIEVDTIPLGDFHVLRAVITKAGLVEEEEVVTTCRNCGAELRVEPCAALEIGPWVDGELGDEELDATLPIGEAVDVRPILLGRVRMARYVVFEALTVKGARPLFAALGGESLEIDAGLVAAMGIVALGNERDRARIAEALATCEDASFDDVSRAFVDTHYVRRLACVAFCAACRARNDVDAPCDREFMASAPPLARESASALPVAASSGGPAFPTLDAFAARARDIARPLQRDAAADVELVVEGETPAVDDGGEPLLGSYLPPHPGDMSTPTHPPCVTVYYRTFLAIWDEEGPYDWEGELRETIEHELEHHVYFLRGEDPMDDEERAEIRDEAVRIVGRREAERRAIAGFGSSLSDFVKRTWPLWLVALVALLAMLARQRE
ncbi:MAG: metallopeptidase family protein [Labilithrix sp.]|nr:metallopeptidase family protein [Labilithrix sp.]